MFLQIKLKQLRHLWLVKGLMGIGVNLTCQ